MEYLIEKDKLKVETCFGYWIMNGESYKEWFSDLIPNNKIIDDEDIFRLYEYKIKDDLYTKLKENLPCAYAMLHYTVILDDEDYNENYRLHYTKYNTSSPFALFLCNLDYISLEEENEEE